METRTGPRIFAYGRDPNFDGWPDTLQVDYGNPDLQDARIAELLDIAGQCDGVRCNMAMLVLPEVFRRTWGIDMAPFWPRAIASVREQYPDFLFMAEAYRDLEWTLQQQGFDYCYDKRLYDRLRAGRARPVRDHLVAPLDYQDKLARFLENHDEPRAAATFDLPQHRAAAAVTFFAPGLRFLHQGQFDGRRVHVSTHLCRAPDEPVDAEIYERLLAVLGENVVRNGEWRHLAPEPAGPDNGSFDNLVGCPWRSQDGKLLLIVVNYSNTRSQCRLPLPFDNLRNKRLLADRLGEEVYDRDGTELLAPGLFIDHDPWHVNVFSISVSPPHDALGRRLRQRGSGEFRLSMGPTDRVGDQTKQRQRTAALPWGGAHNGDRGRGGGRLVREASSTPRGLAWLNDSVFNAGTGFTSDERKRFGLEGLLPPSTESIDRQVEHVLGHTLRESRTISSATSILLVYRIGMRRCSTAP